MLHLTHVYLVSPTNQGCCLCKPVKIMLVYFGVTGVLLLHMQQHKKHGSAYPAQAAPPGQ